MAPPPSSLRTGCSPLRPTRSSSLTVRATSAPSRRATAKRRSSRRSSPRSRSSTRRKRSPRRRPRSTCTDAGVAGGGADQPGPHRRWRLGICGVGPADGSSRARAGCGARRGAGGCGARVDRRGRGSSHLSRAQRARHHPWRHPRLHAGDDHGLSRDLPEDSGGGFRGRRGTIYVTGSTAKRRCDRDSEDCHAMKARAAVSRPGVFLLLAAILSGAGPATGATLFVTNTKSDSASIIDTDTLEAVGTIPLGQGKPDRIVFHPDGRTAWVVYDKSHDLGVIDADTSSDEVIFYDLKAEKIDGRVDVSTWPAHAIFSRDGKLLYVSGETAGDVTVIDVAQRTVVGRIVHGGGDAMGLALTADGKTLYAAAGENKAILKIDTGTNKAVGEIPLPGIVHEATLTLDGKYLYTTLRKINKIVVVRTSDDKIVATIPQKGYPDLVTMEPTGRRALVTNRWADLVSVIDLASHDQVRTIPVGKAPHGMALRPR